MVTTNSTPGSIGRFLPTAASLGCARSSWAQRIWRPSFLGAQ